MHLSPLCQMDFVSPSNSHSLMIKVNMQQTMQTSVVLQDVSTPVSLTLPARTALSIQSFPW